MRTTRISSRLIFSLQISNLHQVLDSTNHVLSKSCFVPKILDMELYKNQKTTKFEQPAKTHLHLISSKETKIKKSARFARIFLSRAYSLFQIKRDVILLKSLSILRNTFSSGYLLFELDFP